MSYLGGVLDSTAQLTVKDGKITASVKIIDGVIETPFFPYPASGVDIIEAWYHKKADEVTKGTGDEGVFNEADKSRTFTFTLSELVDPYFTMLVAPMGDAIMTARLNFDWSVFVDETEKHDVQVKAGAGGTVNTAGGNYAEGETVDLVATANSGYTFKNWTLSGEGSLAAANAAKTTFTAGKGSAVVTANFQKDSGGSADTGISSGTYSVPVSVRNAENPANESMAGDAVVGTVKAQVTKSGVTYTLTFQAKKFSGQKGHLLKMWHYAADDADRTNPMEAEITETYEDTGLEGTKQTFPRKVQLTREGKPEEELFIKMQVDAMGDTMQPDALLRINWDDAVKDGGSSSGTGGTGGSAEDLGVETLTSGKSLSASKISSLIQKDGELVVETDTKLAAQLEAQALKTIADQTSDSVKFELTKLADTALNAAQKKALGAHVPYALIITAGDKKITDLGKATAALTVPYTLGADEKAAGLIVWAVDDKGAVKKLACTYNEKNKTVSFRAAQLAVFAVSYDAAEVWSNPFTDVNAADWHYDAVRYAVQNKLFSGTGETSFAPDAAMTRAMLVTVLHRMAGTPAAAGKKEFSDVSAGQYYTNAVLWAAENGVVSGYENSLFGTDDVITREQLATILYRYAASKGQDVSARAALSQFKDAAAVESYAKDAVQWAVSAGLISGTSETTLSPKSAASRAQVAAILMRLAANAEK